MATKPNMKAEVQAALLKGIESNCNAIILETNNLIKIAEKHKPLIEANNRIETDKVLAFYDEWWQALGYGIRHGYGGSPAVYGITSQNSGLTKHSYFLKNLDPAEFDKSLAEKVRLTKFLGENIWKHSAPGRSEAFFNKYFNGEKGILKLGRATGVPALMVLSAQITALNNDLKSFITQAEAIKRIWGFAV